MSFRASALLLPLAALLCWLSSPGRSAPGSPWLKLTTPHFELYTTADEAVGRECILYFERLRAIFLRVWRSETSSAAPVRLVVFDSIEDYEPYSPYEAAAAFYAPGRDRGFIVMSEFSARSQPLAAHEYVHLLVDHAGLDLPPWLNEGLAELYSTLSVSGGAASVGRVIPGSLDLLRRGEMLELAALTAVDRRSPLYNEKERAGMFYAQSWALAHMLNLSPAYARGFPEFLRAVADGVSSVEAFQQVYGKSLEAVFKDLRRYVRGNQFSAAVFPAGLEEAAEEPGVTPASPLETDLTLAELLERAGKQEEASARYSALAKKHPTAPEIPEAAGYRAWRRGDAGRARALFQKAAQLGSRNPQLYYDYAGLLEQAGAAPERQIALLRKAVALDPGAGRARYALGLLLMDAGAYGEALANLSQVEPVAPRQAYPLFHAAAYASLRLGKLEAAREYAVRAQDHAASLGEREAIEELLESIRRGEAIVGASGAGPPLQEPHARPSPDAGREQEPETE